jgi:hypothetical protein
MPGVDAFEVRSHCERRVHAKPRGSSRKPLDSEVLQRCVPDGDQVGFGGVVVHRLDGIVGQRTAPHRVQLASLAVTRP